MTNRIKLYFQEHQNFLACLIIFLALITFYNDVVFRGKTFLVENSVNGTLLEGPYNYEEPRVPQRPIDSGAIGWFHEPLNRFISRSIKAGDFPLWNPYSGLAGSPIYSDGINGLLEPIQFFFYLFPDALWTYTTDIQLLVRYFLAGFFCYLFARRLKIGVLGGIASGILFMLCAYFVRYGNHPQIKPDVLLPLILYCFDRLADPEDKKAVWISAFAICWIIFAAMPESTFFAFALGSLWFLYRSLWNVMGTPNRFKVIGPVAARYFGVLTTGFALSAVYFVPFIDFISQSASIHHPGATSSFYLPFWALTSVVILIPQPIELARYHVGFISIVLSTLALMTINKTNVFRKETYFFAGYAIISFLIIFNFPLLSWISRLPVVSQVTFSKYSLPSIMFCLALLAGIAIEKIPAGIFSKQSMALIVVIECVVFLIFPILSNLATFTAVYLHRDYAFGFLLVILISAILYGLSVLVDRKKISGGLLQYLLVLMVCVEPFLWNVGFNKPNRVDPFQAPPFVKFLQNAPRPFRIYGASSYLYPNTSSAYGISDIRYLYALIPKTTYEFSTKLIAPDLEGIRLTGNETPVSARMFDLLNVKYMIGTEDLSVDKNYALAYQADGINVYQSKGGAQPVFFINDIRNVGGLSEALGFLENTQSDLHSSAVVENGPADLIDRLKQYKHSNFQLLDYKQVKSGELEMTIQTDHPGLLMVSTQYFPGWQAEIDGKAGRIYKTDGIFVGVFIEEGLHKLVLEYNPISLKIGLIISLCALIFILALILGSSPITSTLSRFIRKNRR